MKFVIYFLLVVIPSLSVAAPSLEEVANSQKWQRLLHIKKSLFGHQSEIKDPRFYISPEGMSDPLKELKADVELWTKDPNQQCRFPARSRYLRNMGLVPEVICAEREAWKKRLGADKISLIFASAYLNNPASMFGHTFLKLHTQNNGADRDLMNYGVNFAASTGSDGGIPFAFKGLFGFYPGNFSMMPYHQRLLDYSSLEGREIWEYEINLTPEQVDELVEHLMELDSIQTSYYFFDRNCSYQLLSLFEVVRPDLNLTDEYVYHVIPADTIQQVTDIPGLVRSSRYRPSLRARFESRQLNAPEEAQTLALNWRDKIEKSNELPVAEISSFSKADTRAQALDILLDYGAIRAYQDSGSVWAEKEFELKGLRASSGITAVDAPIHEPIPVEKGHASARIGLEGRIGPQDQRGLFLNFRPAYHDLYSSDEGYLRGSQIRFLELSAGGKESSNIKLDSFTLLDIVSLSPINSYFTPTSWRLNLSSDHLFSASKDFYHGSVGGGVSFSGDKWLAGAFLETQWSQLEGEASAGSLSFGPSVIVRLNLSHHLRALADLKILWPTRNDVLENYKHFEGGFSYSLGKNDELRLTYKKLLEQDEHESIYYLHYF
ncbi:MAG: DUF4105 domain-containing protein [Bacillota bacterium]